MTMLSPQSPLSTEYFFNAVNRLLARAIKDKAHPAVLRHLQSVLDQHQADSTLAPQPAPNP